MKLYRLLFLQWERCMTVSVFKFFLVPYNLSTFMNISANFMSA
jgi:hypothetical protein